MTRAAVVLWGVVLAGCGTPATSGGGGQGGGIGAGGGMGGLGGGSGSSAEQACTAYATALCNRVDVCIPYGTKAFSGDVATCISRYKLSCIHALGVPTTGATPSKLNACAATLGTASCASIREGTAGCQYAGTQAAGTGCGSNSQCASAYCKYTTSPSCGVCANRVSNGGTCGSPADCIDGSTCVSGVCRAKGAAGASCGSTAPCGDGLFCASGQCAPAGTTAGAPCDFFDIDSCDYLSGLFCNSQDVCSVILLADAGKQCGISNTSVVFCSYNGTCQGTSTAGTCVAVVADGQPCNATQGRNCHDPAICLNGVCTVVDPKTCN